MRKTCCGLNGGNKKLPRLLAGLLVSHCEKANLKFTDGGGASSNVRLLGNHLPKLLRVALASNPNG